MLPERRTHRRETKELKASLGRFEARLDSTHEGIAFHTVISARIRSAPPYPMSTVKLAAEIRITLRHAAADVLQQHAAVDISAVQDLLARELGRERELITDPPVAFDATVTLGLLPGDQTAVDSLLAAQREQTINDARRRQKTAGLALELSDPAAVLARWFEEGSTDWSKAGQDKASEAAEIFARHRRPEQQQVEHALVEAVREFLGSFTDPAQKQMLYGLLASSMRAAERPLHAARVGALAEASHQHGPRTVSHDEDNGHRDQIDRARPVSTTVWRCLLSPRTSWLAWRLSRHTGDDFDVTWRQARVIRHPEEANFRSAGHHLNEASADQSSTHPPTVA